MIVIVFGGGFFLVRLGGGGEEGWGSGVIISERSDRAAASYNVWNMSFGH